MQPSRFAPVPFWNPVMCQEARVRLTARQRVLTLFVSRVTLMDGDDRWRGLEKALPTASGAWHGNCCM